MGGEAMTTRRLDYEEEEGLLSPVRLDLDIGSASMRKKANTGITEAVEMIGGIELFPMELPQALSESETPLIFPGAALPSELVYATLKKPHLVDESMNILIRKAPFQEM